MIRPRDLDSRHWSYSAMVGALYRSDGSNFRSWFTIVLVESCRGGGDGEGQQQCWSRCRLRSDINNGVGCGYVDTISGDHPGIAPHVV
ncbi:hypothetical protein Tco_0257727 [Tanacetum coccineum]